MLGFDLLRMSHASLKDILSFLKKRANAAATVSHFNTCVIKGMLLHMNLVAAAAANAIILDLFMQLKKPVVKLFLD